jgi:isopenicillin N synthase-like dioxygenase
VGILAPPFIAEAVMKVQSIDFRSPDAPELFTRSLRETGFAVVNNHPIDHSLILKVYDDWRIFFNDDRKLDYLFSQDTQQGYYPRNVSETAKGYDVKDIKEFFNVYPSGEDRYPDFIDDASKQLAKELAALASTLLQWIELNTPADIQNRLSMPLNQMIKDSPRTLFRIIHYPPLTGNEEPGAVRSAEHEDIDLITCLPAATEQGLEVKDSSGQWQEVPCDVNSIVVNVGDMLQMCSEGYYPSTSHRVCNPKGVAAQASRFSMPLFLQPKDDVRLSTKYTAKDYLEERFREIGVLKAD